MSTPVAGAPGSAAPATPTPASSPEVKSNVNPEANIPGSSHNPPDVVASDMSADEAGDAIDEAEESGEISEKEAKSLRKKYKVKVFGKEKEVEFDPTNEEEVAKYIQKAMAHDEKSQEHAGFKSQVDQFFKNLKENPEEILEKMGFDVDDFAYKRLDKKVKAAEKDASMTPEQKEQEEIKAELEKLRKEKDELKTEKEKQEREAITQKMASEIQSGIIGALEKTGSKLPKNNPMVIAKIAQKMQLLMSKGYENVKVEDVVPFVEKEYKKEISDLFSILPEDIIEEFMGKGNYDRLRKKKLTAAKAKKAPVTAAQSVKDTGASVQKSSDKPVEKVKANDFFSKLK